MSQSRKKKHTPEHWLVGGGLALFLAPIFLDSEPVRLSEAVTGGGRTITITTVQGQGPGVPSDETVDQCYARHTATVIAITAHLNETSTDGK